MDIEFEDEMVEDIDEANESENDTLNDILTESQYMDDHSEDIEDEDGFEKNKEGVTGDEWEDEAKKQLEAEMDAEEESRKEQNRKNAERRLAAKKKKQEAEEDEDEESDRLEDDSLDSAELEVVKSKIGKYEQMINEAAPFMDSIVKSGLNKEGFETAIDFAKGWNTDPIGVVKHLLTILSNNGIEIGRILTHDDRESQIRGEVDRRMQPMYSQQQQMNAQMRAQNEVNSFLAKYPDANGHLEEITQVLRKLGSNNLEDAYFRMRRAYRDRNMSWFGDEVDNEIEDEVLNEQPSVASNSVGGYIPPQQPTSVRDLVRQNTRNYFNRR